MRKVLDSYSIIAFLENEPGADKVAEHIRTARDTEKPLYLSVINWGEIYYINYRAAGKAAAEKSLEILDTLPIEIVEADIEITKIASELKSTHKMSYADCFAAALAKQKKAAIVTGDKEFKQVEGALKVLWIE